MSPNHRANDVVAVTGAQQFISGKFAYGPVDLAALSGEKVWENRFCSGEFFMVGA